MRINTSMMPNYVTQLFCDIYPDSQAFLTDYGNLGIPTTISVQNATTLYYLLFSRFGNTPIANFDVTMFKLKIQSLIYMYGPTWEKRLDIQNKLRGLTEEELLKGAKTIYNHAYNPETEPSGEELSYINEQNTQNFVKNKLTAYSELMSLLQTDVTGEFLNRFKPLFKIFVKSERPHIFITDVDGDDDE